MSLPPGPRAPAPLQSYRLIRTPVQYLEACRREFGDTFTVRAAALGTLVFVSDPASIKALFAPGLEFTNPPGRTQTLGQFLGRRSLFVLEGDEHRSRRKLMMPPFHGAHMQAYERTIEQATEAEVSSWVPGETFSLHSAMQAITLEVMMRAVFGVSESRRDQLERGLLAILAATSSPLAFGQMIPGVRRLPRYRRLARTLLETREVLAAEIADRRAASEDERGDDILSLLIAARDEQGEAMDDRELRHQLMTLLMAGHETTATAITWAFDLILRSQPALDRLLAELGEGRDGYLDAVIDKSMRVRPIVPFTGRKLTAPLELAGYELPAGTVAEAGIYLAHTNPDLYPDPYEFQPERFLESPTETYSWIPFGGGTRRCIGAAFAKFEMKIIIRTILTRARLAPARPEPEEIVRRNLTLAPRHGMPAVALG